MLRLRDNLNAEDVLFSALSLGLALLTKGTAYLYCAAIGISLTVPVLLASRHNRRRFLKAIAALLTVVMTALLMNSGYFLRNYRLYGQPLPTEVKQYRNEEFSAATLVSNILRNGALHLGTPSRRINRYQYRILQALLGPQLNNPKTTWKGTSFRVPNYSLHEDLAGNLIQMLIVLLSILLLPIVWVRGHHTRTISNVTRMIAHNDVLPLYVIATKPLHTWKYASKYACVYTSDHVSVFRKSGANNIE